MKTKLVPVAMIAFAFSLVVASQASASAVTVARSSFPIVAFAHDGNWVAWQTRPCSGGSAPHPLRLRSLATGAHASVAVSPFCAPTLALGGDRALWRNVDRVDGAGDARMLTAAASDPAQRAVDSFFQFELNGETVRAASGDGGTLVYSRFAFHDDAGCLSQPVTCHVVITGGVTYRVVNNHKVTIPGAPGAVMLSAAGSRVALVPIVVGSVYRRQLKAGTPVEVRDVATGAVISSFSPVGKIRGISLNGSLVAVLVQAADKSQRIELYDAATGVLAHSSRVAPDVRATIDMSAAGILFAHGRTLRLLSRTGGSARTIAALRTAPFRYSIENRTVVWAINMPGHSFIRRLIVSGLA